MILHLTEMSAISQTILIYSHLFFGVVFSKIKLRLCQMRTICPKIQILCKILKHLKLVMQQVTIR